MDNFVFITADGHPLSIADRLKDEGKNVLVGMVEDPPSEESAETEEKRQELYEGILDKLPAEKLLKEMESFPNKDEWFVVFDYGDLWPWSERALDMGFTKGIFPTEEGYALEKDRMLGKSFAQKHYPNLKVAEAPEFSSADDARDFLEEQQDKIFVLKSEGSEAETVVPATTDPGLAKLQILGALLAEQAEYEKGSFTLEEKIRQPIELSPVMVFWEGKPLFSLVEIENKGYGAGNIGRLTGGCQNLTLHTPLDCQLNQMAFPPIIFDMASKQPGIGIYDAGILFNQDDGQFYFTEFCSQRWGWDGIFSELAMSRNGNNHFVSRHFDMIAQGESPIANDFGVAVRMFQTQPDSEKPEVYKDGYTMDWLNEVSNNLFFYCIRKERDGNEARFLSVGYGKDLGVAVGSSRFLEAAVDEAYHALKGFAMTGVYYRPRFDFLSKDYPTSIMNRYRWLVNSGLV